MLLDLGLLPRLIFCCNRSDIHSCRIQLCIRHRKIYGLKLVMHASPGTMCASVICAGSHGMSRLHVWVDWITLPFGNVIVIGWSAILLFMTGAPSTRKWPVAPESEMACLTDRVTRAGSNMVAACGKLLRLLAWIVVSQALALVGIVIGTCGIAAICLATLDSSSSDESYVVTVMSLSLPLALLLWQTVSSSAKSPSCKLYALFMVGFNAG